MSSTRFGSTYVPVVAGTNAAERRRQLEVIERVCTQCEVEGIDWVVAGDLNAVWQNSSEAAFTDSNIDLLERMLRRLKTATVLNAAPTARQLPRGTTGTLGTRWTTSYAAKQSRPRAVGNYQSCNVLAARTEANSLTIDASSSASE